MRYEDWDILLFPRDCKVPVKEFRVACHLVPDAESKLPQLQFGLPTVCCFIPSLPSGAPFQVSIHSWSVPVASQASRCFSEYSPAAQFEARLFIDGRLVASSILGSDGDWPHVIAHGFNMWRNGSLEALKFPEFRQELLQQSHWSPADAFGRIKVLISEGLARDSMTMATERIKNIVAFSFQHAPLDILEMSSIAWPNPSMWRRTPLVSSMAVPSNHADEADSHAHSPRRRPVSMQGNATSMGTPFTQDMAYRPGLAAGARHVSQPASGTVGFNLTDPFGDAAAYLDWLGSMDASLGATLRSSNQENTRHANPRRQNTDISMPDYVPMTSGDQGAVASEHPNAGHGLGHEDETGTNQLKVPTNTPTTGGQGNLDAQDGMSYPAFSQPTPIPCDLATSLTNSLLNQPMPLHFPQSSFHELVPVVRSRKEKRSQLPDAQLPAASIAGQEQQEMRRVSQQMYIPSGGSMPVCNVAMQKDSPQAPDNGGVGTQAGTKGAVLACGEANSEQDFFCKDGITAQPLNSPCGIMTERGNKRLRNLTPGSSRGLDDDDEPRRASSRATCSPLVTETEERK